MPWKETSVTDERTKFIGRLLSGEKMATLCREFGISRVTGHKIWNRYQQDGISGGDNRSRASHKHPNQVPFEIEQLIVRLKKEKPRWGAPKIRELVARRHPSVKLLPPEFIPKRWFTLLTTRRVLPLGVGASSRQTRRINRTH